MCHRLVSSLWFLVPNSGGGGQDARRRYFFFFGAAFFAAGFFAAVFLAEDFAFASTLGDSSTSTGLAFFGFASFFGSSGAVNFWPSNAISVMRTAVYPWRCPRSFLYCFLRL